MFKRTSPYLYHDRQLESHANVQILRTLEYRNLPSFDDLILRAQHDLSIRKLTIDPSLGELRCDPLSLHCIEIDPREICHMDLLGYTPIGRPTCLAVIQPVKLISDWP
jgi:hypothetical protein